FQVPSISFNLSCSGDGLTGSLGLAVCWVVQAAIANTVRQHATTLQKVTIGFTSWCRASSEDDCPRAYLAFSTRTNFPYWKKLTYSVWATWFGKTSSLWRLR